MIDRYLNRMPNKNYNCLDFVKEVWFDLFSSDVKERLNELCKNVSNGKIYNIRGFMCLSKPISPCFIVMRRYKLSPHIGIFYNNKVLHMTEKGVEYQPIQVAKRYFTKIGFYR